MYTGVRMRSRWIWRCLFVAASVALILSMIYDVGAGYIVAIVLGLLSLYLRLSD